MGRGEERKRGAVSIASPNTQAIYTLILDCAMWWRLICLLACLLAMGCTNRAASWADRPAQQRAPNGPATRYHYHHHHHHAATIPLPPSSPPVSPAWLGVCRGWYFGLRPPQGLSHKQQRLYGIHDAPGGARKVGGHWWHLRGGPQQQQAWRGAAACARACSCVCVGRCGRQGLGVETTHTCKPVRPPACPPARADICTQLLALGGRVPRLFWQTAA